MSDKLDTSDKPVNEPTRVHDQPTPGSSASMTRRAFNRSTVAGAAAVGLGALPQIAEAASKPSKPAGETLVQQLYKSLNDKQKEEICFGIDHKLRNRVENNWRITRTIDRLLTNDQQDLVKQIVVSLHSERYAGDVLKQINHDNRGKEGFRSCAVAFFGHPDNDTPDKASAKGSDATFEFVFTGRHVTRRCDGAMSDGAAFGGPIFYGHAAESFNEKPTHPGNIYWYQAKRANAVFDMLDGKQRKLALRDDAPRERGTSTVAIHKPDQRHGLPVREMSKDQKAEFAKVMADVLAPFREQDVAEAMRLIKQGGGLDAMQMAFYSNLDVGKDKVWDVWQIEGPNMVWYFRGYPHVHTWVNIKKA